jgi:hypothetical protein
LFSGIIFDGYNGSSMRLIRWNHTHVAANSSDYGYYLVSDYARLGTRNKSVSWRYSWLEGWVLDYLTHLDWSAVSQEKVRTDQATLEAQRTGLREKSAQTQAELIRLLNLAKSSDLPPETLLQEMQRLDKEQKLRFSAVAELEARIEAITAKQALVSAERRQIEELAQAGDVRSRLRLREAIRKQVRRIEVFPQGVEQRQLGHDSGTHSDLPCFRMIFFNAVVRWVNCPS